MKSFFLLFYIILLICKITEFVVKSCYLDSEKCNCKLDTIILMKCDAENKEPASLDFDYLKYQELNNTHAFYLTILYKVFYQIKSSNLNNLLLLIEFLTITGNKIHSIQNESFQSLINLKKLNLYDNEIEFIDEKAFSQLKNLISLDLSVNKLKFIQNDLFINLIQ